MREIFIDVENGSNNTIKVTQNDNLTESYKLIITENKIRLDLTNKKVKFAFVKSDSHYGDIIEELKILNAIEGEVEFKVVNRITKVDGLYSCGLAVYDDKGFLEHTGTFSLYVRESIFEKVSGELIKNSAYKELMSLLDKATNLNKELTPFLDDAERKTKTLKETIITATNSNKTLTENTNVADTLNTNLENNIAEAKKTNDDSITKDTALKETVKKAETINTELTNTNSTANDTNTTLTANINEAKKVNDTAITLKNDLENDINQANNLKNNLETNTNRATTINDTLVKNTATAEEKNTTLNNSLEETKKYINGLDGSQNIPQICMDVDALQNGLKSNQELAYEGTNLKCENTLDGRIEDIVLEGMTYQNLITTHNIVCVINKQTNNWRICDFALSQNLIQGKEYTICFNILKYRGNRSNGIKMFVATTDGSDTFDYMTLTRKEGKGIFKYTPSKSSGKIFKIYIDQDDYNNNDIVEFSDVMILEGDYTNKYISHYFESIKSVAESEENKVKVLSCGKNLFNINKVNIENPQIKNIQNGYELTSYSNSTSKKVKDLFPFFEVGKTYTVSFDYDNNNGTDNNVSGSIGFFDTTSGLLFLKKGDKVQITEELLNRDVILYGSQTVKTTITNIQFVEGDKNSNYEPHKQDKRELKLPFEGGLKGLPNRSKDLIYNKDDGCYVMQKIGTQIFDENSPLQFNKGDSNGNYLSMPSKTHQCECICNKLISVIDGSIDKNIYITANTWVIINRQYSSLEEYKNWLRENPLIAYYELDTPIETKISDTKLSLDTYNALTYVFSNNAISPNIKLKVASNLGSIIQQNAKSINDIYKLIDEVLIPQIATNTADIAVLKLK